MERKRKKQNQAGTEVWIFVISLFVIGLLLFIWPAMSSSILCYLIGAACLGYGIFQVITYFSRPIKEEMGKYTFAKGLAAFIAGVVLFVKPGILVAILPVLFGLVLVISGILKLQVGLDLMRIGKEHWYIAVVWAGVVCVLGIIAMVNPFGALFGLMRFIGAALILEGISDVIAAITLSKSQTNGFADGR
ncbi:MAG: HdeD family acid-resistance protein [Oscillospiraceae bacterium]|jgi:uncharacterized membrane protein HdeD (DUF308 family)